jgi:trehalose 6-phosphate phosphatase
VNDSSPPSIQSHWRDVLPNLQRRLGAEQILVASDFDGTISAIAPSPDEAVVMPAARAALDRLSQLPGVTVAVVSGRSLSGVKQKVDLPALVYAGNHGVEMEGPHVPPLTIFTEDARRDLEAALASLHDALDWVAGVLIEDKGSSLSVHYRQAAPADLDFVAAAVTAAGSLSPRIQIRRGKMVQELRPDLGWNKGSAVMHLMTCFKIHPAAAFFLGDDETDDDVFRVLPLGGTFIIGERPSRDAAFRCRDPDDAAELLTWMADQRERHFTAA